MKPTQPYVYSMVSKDGHLYYGCRHAQGCHPDELGVSYFSSSKIVHQLIKEHGKDYFMYEVVQLCSSSMEALQVEASYIIEITDHPKCLNMFLCKKDGTPVYLGSFGPRSEETKRKISESNLGRKVDSVGRQNMRESKIGTTWSQVQREAVKAYQQTPEYKELRTRIAATTSSREKTPEELAKISNALKGRKKPEGFGAQVSATNKARNATLRIWQTNRAQPLRDAWAKADQFYQLWKNEGWGHERFCNRMHDGLNVRTFYNMYKMFKYDGWIPSQDSDWVKDFH
ncbi:hypothetical protein HWB57_gp129 [Erwinia phage vB_EamM-Bue1]|uniref:Nuclease associated modular domain-containing protein n=1 Tax=Erwinia phage vB_EamM-Bue1 TaxID=2099338 RepID=A0A2P1JUD1_9CAUD|nr:hypothetical protein HWB57_gp129 [Erwinia phage vB_EamM-Bue1]AVO22966.1 hypothetical protein [Erwinia phage vB_EamM-Bue1]